MSGKYPKKVCYDCAMEASGMEPHFSTTYEKGSCGICKKQKSVCDPSHFGYPEFKTDDKT